MITSGGGPGVWGLLGALRTLPEQHATVIVSDPSDDITLGTGLADIAIRLPDAAEDGYSAALLDFCVSEQVDVLIPVYDGELTKVSELCQSLHDGGTRVLMPSEKVVRTCSDKVRTYSALAETTLVPDFKIANTIEDLRSAIHDLGANHRPLCVRPPISTGSRGVHFIEPDEATFEQRMTRRLDLPTCSASEFLRWRTTGPEHYPLLVSEYLPGNELGIDLLANQGDVIEMCIRRKGGGHLHGNPRQIHFEQNTEIERWVAELASELSLDALTAIDARYDGAGNLKLLEVNPRPGAYIGMSCARRHILARAIDELLNNQREPEVYTISGEVSGGLRLFADSVFSGDQLKLLSIEQQEWV